MRGTGQSAAAGSETKEPQRVHAWTEPGERPGARAWQGMRGLPSGKCDRAKNKACAAAGLGAL
ncbi:hypothetical protein GCM10027082_40250 [Comamonas humi]